MQTPDEQTSASTKTKSLIPNQQAQKDMIRAIFYCLLVVVLIRSFIVEPFRIPSSSMVPTLRVGDHIFVAKFSYGFSIPFTKVQFLNFAEPQRGDVIVFLWPRDESFHYVKRVVGIPGDKIQIKGPDILINDKLVVKTNLPEDKKSEELSDDIDDDGIFFVEKIESVSHLIRHHKERWPGHESRNIEEVIPPNQYFVMGDNRDDSSDSRSWGLVPRENIRGKAKLIWMSLEQAGAWNNLRKIRWARCLKLIS